MPFVERRRRRKSPRQTVGCYFAGCAARSSRVARNAFFYIGQLQVCRFDCTERRRRTQEASLFDVFESASERVATVSISGYT
jgi:hypothetical protein